MEGPSRNTTKKEEQRRKQSNSDGFMKRIRYDVENETSGGFGFRQNASSWPKKLAGFSSDHKL